MDDVKQMSIEFYEDKNNKPSIDFLKYILERAFIHLVNIVTMGRDTASIKFVLCNVMRFPPKIK